MLFLALRVAPATAQNSSDAPQVPGLDQSRPPTPEEEDRMRRAKDLAKRENQERQAQLKRDTDHLLKLAVKPHVGIETYSRVTWRPSPGLQPGARLKSFEKHA